MSQYFNDFSHYPTGAQPSDWVKRWNTGAETWNVLADGAAAGGKLLQSSIAAQDDRVLSWNLVDGTQNIELVAKVRTSSVTAYQNHLHLRGSGTGSSKGSYYLVLYQNTTSTYMILEQWFNNTYYSIQTVTKPLSPNTWYWMRFRANGNVLQAKMWADGTAEPAGWDIAYTDSTGTANNGAGWAGVGGYSTAGLRDFDVIGVGTNGDTAPTSAAQITKTHTIDTYIYNNNLPVQNYAGTLWLGGWGGVGYGMAASPSAPNTLQLTQEIPHTIDTLIRKQATLTHTVDAVIRQQLSLTHTLDSLIRAQITKLHTIDGLIRKQAQTTHTIDAFIKPPLANQVIHNIDTLIRRQYAITHTLDASISKRFNLSHTVDALIRRQASINHTADSLIRGQRTVSHTIDAAIAQRFTKNHSIDTLLRAQMLVSHNIDALIAIRLQLTHTIDAAYYKPVYLMHTISASIIDRKPWTPYGTIDKPLTGYVDGSKPATTFSAETKPQTTYAIENKPKTPYNDEEKPPTRYKERS